MNQPPRYQNIEDLLGMIDEPNREPCLKLLDDNRELFVHSRGSKVNHQAWEGGYFDHVVEVMNLAIALYEPMNSIRPLPFSLSDALLVLYLHDVEKPWKYEKVDGKWDVKPEFKDKSGFKDREFTHRYAQAKMQEYGFQFTSDHQNGLRFVEGEISEYSNSKRNQGPLAAFAHLCDVTSARIWFDHPTEKDDPWKGAKRINSK